MFMEACSYIYSHKHIWLCVGDIWEICVDIITFYIMVNKVWKPDKR